VDMRQLEDLIGPLQEAFAVDGVAVTVGSVEGCRLVLSVDTTTADCAECIVPDEVIGSMVLAHLQRAGGAGAAIEEVDVQHVGAGAA
jgi:hypothetical protein